MTNDLLDAFGYPPAYHMPKGRAVSWDGLNDWLFPVTDATQPVATTDILLIRESGESAEHNLALLVDILDWRKGESARLAAVSPHLLGGDQHTFLVLAGWPRDTIGAKVERKRTRIWTVNQLRV